MKKITALFITACFLFISAGAAWAADPVVSVLDRHAVWTKGSSDQNTQSSREMKPVISGYKSAMSRDGRFGFIHETKWYDYAKDRGNHA